MKTLWLTLSFLALSTDTFGQTNARPAAHLLHQTISDVEIEKAQYPQASYLQEVTQRLLEVRASTWLAARVYHTEDSIKVVAKYFKQYSEKANRRVEEDMYLKSLLRDNWEIEKRTLA